MNSILCLYLVEEFPKAVMTATLGNAMEALDLTHKPVLEEEKEKEDFVDPWNVVGSSVKGIDYEKLISEEKANVRN